MLTVRVGERGGPGRARGPGGERAVHVRRHELAVVLPGGGAHPLPRPARAQAAAPLRRLRAQVPYHHQATFERYQ